MDKKETQKLAEIAGITWLTTKDLGDEIARFATLVEQAEREAIIGRLQAHLTEPQVVVVIKLTDSPR